MSSKSDDELNSIAASYQSYSSDALKALISESEKRNIVLPELSSIKNKLTTVEREISIEKEVSAIPDNLPSTIRLASDLFFATIPLGFINLIVFESIGLVAYDSGQLLSAIFTWLLTAGIAYWIRTGSAVSRIVLTIMTAIGILVFIPVLIQLVQVSILASFLATLINIIGLTVVFLLFKKTSQEWYLKRKN